jgi:hypothetical protein
MEGWCDGRQRSERVLHEEGGVRDSLQDKMKDWTVLTARSPKRGSGGGAAVSRRRSDRQGATPVAR